MDLQLEVEILAPKTAASTSAVPNSAATYTALIGPFPTAKPEHSQIQFQYCFKPPLCAKAAIDALLWSILVFKYFHRPRPSKMKSLTNGLGNYLSHYN